MFLLMRGAISLLISVLLTMTLAASSSGATLPFRLTWDRNAETDVAFYTIYYGSSSRNYTHFIDKTNPLNPQQDPHCDFCDRTSPDCDPSYAQITPGTYYITVTATDYALNESDFSTELFVRIDPPPPSSTTTRPTTTSTTARPTTTSTTARPTTTSTTTTPSPNTSTIISTTTAPSTTTTASTGHGITIEDGEDRTTDRWYIYDDLPSGAEIRNVFDNDRQSRAIQFSGSGIDNGFRLTNGDGDRWHNSSHFIIQWNMKYSEAFTIYIDLETTAGHRYLTYTPHDFNNLGYGEYVEHGLGNYARDGQWHTFARDLRADLAQSQPGIRILEVNGFLIRGSGLIDDIMLLNEFSSPTTTTSVTSDREEYCSRDPQLQLNGTPPEEGTMNIVIPAGSLPQDSLSYEDAQDGTTDRWNVYDDSPGGAGIRNVYDNDRRSRVIELSGSGTDNGYRLTNSDGTFWNNDTHLIIKWSMQYAELFTIYVDLETTEGHRYLTYRPNDFNSLGNDEYVLYGLGENAKDGQWHTYVRDLQADLAVAQPGVTILEVNGFLIRGSGKVDDVKLITFEDTISPNLLLTLFDSNTSGEGNMYVNGNGPIAIPTGNYTDREHTFQIPGNPTCLIEGENSFRFTHVGNQGYEVRKLCIEGLLKNSSTPPPSAPSSPRQDRTPPTGTVIINKGDETTNCQIVTLYLSAEDAGSGMGEGSQMMISKHGKEKWSDPMPFEPVKTWTISPVKGIGEKTIYVKLCDAAGNWMEEPVSDNIMLLSYCIDSTKLRVWDRKSSGTFFRNSPGYISADAESTAGWLSPLRLGQRDDHITIDLGENKIVSRLDISPNRFFLMDLFPRDFEIQTSIDNTNWTTQFSVKDYSPSPSGSESWAFEETEARYIRMLITRTKPFLLFFYVTYVGDITVYGCANSEIVSPELDFTSTTHQTDTSGTEQDSNLQGEDENQFVQNKELAQSKQPADVPGTELKGITYKTISPPDGPSPIHTYEDSGIICDNGDPSTSFTGTWDITDAYDCYETSSLIAEQNAAFTWTPDIVQAGSYAVSMWWSSATADCSACPVAVTCNGELKDTLYINQRQGGGRWNLLGTYNLEAGNECSVTITSEGPDLKTCADAVRFVYLGNSSAESQIDFIHPNPALLDEEVCLSGRPIPGNQMSIQDYRWISQLDGEIGTTESFCTSSLSEGIHRISYTIQNDDGLWLPPAEKTVFVVNTFTPPQSVWLEAEAGTLTWPMETEWHDNASNGEYAWVPNESGNVMNPAEDGGHTTYSFELLEAGDFLVWGRLLSSGIGDDSFWISMDNGTWILWDIPLDDGGNWVWDRVSNRGGPDPVVYHLNAGDHTLMIKNREDGAKIDSILITNDIGFKPTGQGN